MLQLPPWPNGQGVGLLIRRLRVRVPQGVFLLLVFRTRSATVIFLLQHHVLLLFAANSMRLCTDMLDVAPLSCKLLGPLCMPTAHCVRHLIAYVCSNHVVPGLVAVCRTFSRSTRWELIYWSGQSLPGILQNIHLARIELTFSV